MWTRVCETLEIIRSFGPRERKPELLPQRLAAMMTINIVAAFAPEVLLRAMISSVHQGTV